MLRAARRRTPPPLPAAFAAAFFASKPQPPPPPPPQLVDAAVSRCPSDALAVSLFVWYARRNGASYPPSSFDNLLPAAARLASRLGKAPAVLRELRDLGCPIKPQTFLLLLRLYWRGGLYQLVHELFEQMPLWGFQPNTFARNVVLDVLLRTGKGEEAQRCLGDNPSPNYLTCAIVLTHHCRAGNWPGARSCLVAMLRLGFLPGAPSLAALFVCCSKTGTMSELLQLLSLAHVSGCQLTSAMWTCLIARLCREERLDEAFGMLTKMVESGSPPTVVTYTSLIRGFLRDGRQVMVSNLLQSMESAGCSPDLVMYNVLMDYMAKERRYDDALNFFMQIHGRKIKPDSYTLSTLARVLQLSSYSSLLPSIPSLVGADLSYDLVACNSVLSALCNSGFPSEAYQFYKYMIGLDVKPDRYTYVALLDSLCQLGRRENYAIDAYHSIVVMNSDVDSYVHATILRGLVRQGRSLVALRILREAVHKNYDLDGVCYTIVLHGLFQDHLVEEACSLFDQMKHSGMAPNTCTYNVMLRGLCRTRDQHAVKQLLTEMESTDAKMDSISFNTVALFLIKSQRIDSAIEIIRGMYNLGMKPSTRTCSLLSQCVDCEFVQEDNMTAIVESDGSESSSDLLVCSAS